MTLPSRVRSPAAALALACAVTWPGVSAAQAPAPDGDPWPQSERIGPLAERVAASGDNQGLPFAVIDKQTAQLAVFDADGSPRGVAPVLLGAATGDGSTPGVGERALAAIAAGERTTPAGRFVAGFGPSTDGSTVLWIDYATAISVHPLIDTNRSERRPERLLSPTPDDNRITYGCINVAAGFYEDIVRTAFARGGVFYVLPEATELAAVFPTLADEAASERFAEAGPDEEADSE